MDELNFLKLQTRCVSHEVRNNLSVCEMYSEIIKKHLLRDGYKNNSVQNALDCIQKSLKVIGNSLLDLKSMNSLTPQTCDIKNLLSDSLEVAKIYLTNREIKYDVKIDLTCSVIVDENKFTACIVNLVKNASEAIGDKGFLNVGLDLSDKFVKIKFENNGSKISEEKQSFLFDPGFTTKSYGSGLGLFICKKNLEMFGADLNLIKSDDVSTVFEILIPRAD